ncbi:ATP-binding protein [Microbacterium sp. SSM24]|uniref:ATP-binding protein n=1 Tax=Microbacterium sp. SSM24 TaxID=2991714 RepID=UPI00222731A0|nr:DUF4062 domain-containing protein [Microbacterium sp. SSM24]MCW3494261.1 DUF4062 domain-containing protein [Microbacterium sp. SSM24]
MPDPDAPAAVIRTPDQRLRVFVSSTLAELAEERTAVRRAIGSLGLAPVMFELGARPHPPQELYRAYLAQSDVFIGLYWQSYGWVGPGMDISGLEDEFRLSGGRPRLLYLKAPADRQPRLEAMIDEIRARGTDAYRTFRSTRELGRLVRDDLALLLSERFVTSAMPLPPEPAAASSPPARRTLPVTTTTLIGRTADVEAVTRLLARDDVRLVNITGPGGMGKTRLAIAVGEQVEQDAAVCVSFVPLASVTDAADVLPRVAAALGVTIEGTRTARDALVDHFSSGRALLILDNLEQLTAIAPALDDLLTATDGLRILVTSRIALRLRAEHEYSLGALDVGTRRDLPFDDSVALPSVQLFLERAGAVRRDLPLTPDTISAIVEICRRLDGVPLAIELAAARSRLLDPPALLARLASVLDGLGTGPVDLPERQRTLRATVEWSVDLLGEAERDLLATLSVFADGWSIPAASAVAAADEFDTLDRLDSLAGHSLVSVDASSDEPRFRMLTIVRELATEQLAAGGRYDEIRRRHAEFFAGVIDTDDVPADLTTPWAERVRVEEENVRVAIAWFFDNDAARLPHLLRSLWLYWQTNDRLLEGRQWVDDLTVRADPSAWDDRARAEVLLTQAVTAVAVGDDDRAVAAAREIPAVLEQVDEPALRHALELAVSWTLPILDDFDGALDAATLAYDGFSEHDDAFMAFAALTVGMLETTFARDESARRFLLEADRLGSLFGNRWLTSSARTQLAVLDVRAGAFDAARDYLRGCLHEIDDDQVGTITACFMLTAFAELAVAESDAYGAAVALGAVAGLRERAGLLAWPIARREEAALGLRVAAALDADRRAEAWDSGTALRAGEALALVRAGIA